MTVRNIASICNMVSGRRRLGGRALGAAKRRKGNPSRTPAGRPAGVGAWGRRGPRGAAPEVPGPRAGRAGGGPGSGRGRGRRATRPPLGPGTRELARRSSDRAAAPRSSGCGGSVLGGGGRPNPDVPGDRVGRKAGASGGGGGGHPSCPCGR